MTERSRQESPIRAFVTCALLALSACASCDSLWPAPEESGSTSPVTNIRIDRAEEDFEEAVAWEGIYYRPELWTLSEPQDRPNGDEHVLTNTDMIEQPHIALWNSVVMSDNVNARFSVVAKSVYTNWMGVVFNYQTNGTFYLFRVNPASSLWEVQRVSPTSTQTIAGGKAYDQGNLIVQDEYVRLVIGWNAFQKNVLDVSVVSPTTGVHTLASLPISSPLVGGRVGVYSLSGFTYFDDVRLSGRLEVDVKPSITVRADRLKEEPSPQVLGANVIWRGNPNGMAPTIFSEQEYQDAMGRWFGLVNSLHRIGVSSTRYPGGLEALWYMWKHGVGPISSRGNPNDSDTVTIGTDEFLQFTEELGASAVITLNPSFFSLPLGDPAIAQYAADWVEYCNAPYDGSNPGGGVDFAALRAINGHKKPYAVKFWEIGNEIGGLTPDELARIITPISEATRNIDPTIELGFQDHVVSQYYSEIPFNPEARKYYTNSEGTGILDLAGDDFDFWEPHPYGPAILEIGPALFQNGGTLTVSHYFPAPGIYRFVLRGYCANPTPVPIRNHRYGTLSVKLDGSPLWEFEVASESEREWTHESLVPGAGIHVITIQGDNLIENRIIYLTNQLKVTSTLTGETTIADLTNSDEIYGIMQATAPYVEFAYYGLFKEFYAGKRVYPTEWNTTTGFYDSPNDLKWALSNADFLNVFFRNATPLSSFWDVASDRLLVGLLEGVQSGHSTPRLRPTAYVFQLYKSMLSGNMLQVTTTSPYYLRGVDGVRLGMVGFDQNLRIPYLSAVASLSQSKERLSLIVVNKHRTMPIRADIMIQGFVSSGSGTISVIDADEIFTNNERESCPDPGDCVKTVTSSWQRASSRFTYEFPAHSITAFMLYSRGADVHTPVPPSNLAGEVMGESVQLQWSSSPSSDVAGYNLYRSRRPDGPFGNRVNTTPLRATGYLDEDLDRGVTYYYAVTAVDRSNDESALSDKLEVHITGNPSNTHYPSKVQILQGASDGRIEALQQGDYSIFKPLDGDSFYRVVSSSGGTDWVLTVDVAEDPSSVSGMAIYFQALYSRAGSQSFSLWNVKMSRWDVLRSMELHANQNERYMEGFDDPEFLRDHMNAQGEIQLRISAYLGGQYTCYADYCSVRVR